MGARLGTYADLGGRSDDVKCSPNLITDLTWILDGVIIGVQSIIMTL